MFIFNRDLYWDDSLPIRKRDKTIKRLQRLYHPATGFFDKLFKVKPIYVVSLAKSQDQLDIYSSAVLLQKAFRKFPIEVVGVAGSYEGAVMIVMKITKCCYEERKDADIKQFLLDSSK